MTQPTEHIIQFFAHEAYGHLPLPLVAVGNSFNELAHAIVEKIPRSPERTIALRKLLEAQDAAMRAASLSAVEAL